MADALHNPSRRALLGAAVGMPLLPRHPGLDPGSTFSEAGAAGRWIPGQVRNDEQKERNEAAWERALAAYRAAEGELGRFEALCRGRPYEEQKTLEAGYDARSDAMYDALRRLLRAQAPDLAAVAAKMDLVVRHEVGTLTGGERCLAAVRRDVRRMARAAR
jgi:hypothetical protein